MRVSRFIAVAALAVALVFSATAIGFARPLRGFRHGPQPAYRITMPRVASAKVTVGVSFDATGFVRPAIAADDASTTVVIEVRRLNGRRMSAVLQTVPAVLSAVDASSTMYDAAVTLTGEGQFMLSAIVVRDDTVLARSTGRPVRAVLPYRISKPRVESRVATAGVSFDATGVVVPGIATDDPDTTVSVIAYKVGRRGKLTKVDSFEAVNTGLVGEGSGYSASVTLPSAGRYVLVAVVMRDGTILGHSTHRPMRARPAPVV